MLALYIYIYIYIYIYCVCVCVCVSDPFTGPMWPRGWVDVLLYSSMTSALEGGEWSAARPGRTLPPGKTRYLFYRRLDGPQGRSGRAENLVPTGIRSRTVQAVVSRYTDWAARLTYVYKANTHTHTHIYIYIYTGRHKKTGTFEKPNKNWRNSTKKLTEIEPLLLAF